MKIHTSRSSRGFTLVEILAVVAIIMALAGVLLLAVRSSLQKGRVSNAMGTAQALTSAIADYLQKPGSVGVVPLTEGQGTIPGGASAAAATLDIVLLAEGVLEKPLSIRMGQTPTAARDAAPWNVATQAFTNTGSDQSAFARLECALGNANNFELSTDWTTNPSLPRLFRLDGVTPIPSSSRVIYLVIPNVTVSDAYALALSVNGVSVMQNAGVTDEDDAAANGCALGMVTFPPADASTGLTTVYYFVTRQ